MTPFRTILCPTDFSTPAAYALEAAAMLALDQHARLVVVHVTEPMVAFGEMKIPIPATEEDNRRIWQEVAELEKRNPRVHGLCLETRLASGEPASAILAAAQDVDADLIVMGTHGRGGVRRLLMGSVAEEVLRKSSRPVMTVKAGLATFSAQSAHEAGN